MSLEDTLRHPTADGIFEAVPLIVDHMEARPRGEDALSFLRKLKEGPTPEEATTFAAHMFQPRISVWWGHECIHSAPELLGPVDLEMLDLAAAWVGDPNEDTRYAAMDPAMEAKKKTPGVWIALAAGWSGGSLGSREYDPVPPDPVLCGLAVNTGILTLLANGPREQRAPRIERFVQMAEYLAKG